MPREGTETRNSRYARGTNKMHLMPREGTETTMTVEELIDCKMHLMPREGTETRITNCIFKDNEIMHLMPREGTETYGHMSQRLASKANASYAP